MNKERGEQEPNIIDILNDEMRRGSNDPENFPTVQEIAERMGIDNLMLTHWLEKDKEFNEALGRIKEAYLNDPWKDTVDDEIKLGAAVLSFGVGLVLEETKKRYTV
jgi:hypothetical protein